MGANGSETAANLVASARERRDLSQRELARAAGVPQSTVSMIESGKQQPSVAMLERLLAAAGFTLNTRLVNAVAPSVLLARHRERVKATIAEYPVADVWVFGSIARGDDHAGSDVDLLVELKPGATVVDILGLDEALAALLGCPVDVVTTSEIAANHLLRRGVNRHRRPLAA
ncbi:helix-turn-helix domain-containing protein [Actinokineospora sp. 24-640]